MKLVLLLSMAVASFATPLCPTKAVQMNAGSNTCYLPSSIHSDWLSSEGVCQLMGGHLASVKTKVENDNLYKLLLSREVASLDAEYLMGLRVQNGNWVWSDGSPFNYTNWAANYPAIEHLVATMISNKLSGSGGLWNQEPGDNEYSIFPFVCELPPCSTKVVTVGNLTAKHLILKGDNYYFGHYTNKFVQPQASSHCQELGGGLPVIRNAFDNQAVQTSAEIILESSRYNITLDLVPSTSGSSYMWSDGTPLTYTNWAMKEPSHNNSIIRMNIASGLWYADKNPFNFICQLPATRSVCLV